MEYLPKNPPISYTWKDSVRYTPIDIIQYLMDTCVVPGDYDKFQAKLDSFLPPPGPELSDFVQVMIKAIEQDRPAFIAELLRRGVRTDFQSIARRALEPRAKGMLDLFLQLGWQINEPMCETLPPILG
jgi:hypothetical protein